ncbi:6-carboxytetrahydropterin synthase QueD [bacterium]|nr:6-carboxytetrahydropterin synthase QueD [bacterium]
MYELTVDSSFSAAHQLREYDGACSRLHGHSWKVSVTVGVHALDALGIGMDFKKIASVLDGIVDRFDHQNLNDLDEFSTVNPTAENLARIIYDRIAGQIETGDVSVLSVTVAESDRYRVTYSRDRETS